MTECRDMSEIAYGILSYASDCARRGAVPTVEQAYALADCPAPSYWCMVIDSMLDMGLIKGPTVDEYINGDRAVKDGPLYITLGGEQYLQNNSEMKKAKKALGVVFAKALEKAVIASLPPTLII